MQEREEMREECTLRNKRGQYRDKVERITYQIPSVHTKKENGKRHVANRASVRAQDGRTNAREKGKIREHICIREKSGKGIEDRDGYIGKIEGHRGTNTIKEAMARTTRTKSGISVEREGKMRGRTTKIKETKIPYGTRRVEKKKRKRSHRARCTKAKVASSRMKKGTERD